MLCCVLAVRFCFSSVKPEVVTDNVNKDGTRLESVYFGCKCVFKAFKIGKNVVSSACTWPVLNRGAMRGIVEVRFSCDRRVHVHCYARESVRSVKLEEICAGIKIYLVRNRRELFTVIICS